MEEKIRELLQKEYENIEKGRIPQVHKKALKNKEIDKNELAWFLLITEALFEGIKVSDIKKSQIAQENMEVVNKAIQKFEESFNSVIAGIMNDKTLE